MALALRLDLRRVAAVSGALILLAGVLGVLHIVFEPSFGFFDLDGERDAPSAFSAALWVLAALVALLLARAEQGDSARVWRALSVVLFFVSFDEFAEVHERLERITGIDWQVLYSPLALVALVLWLVVRRRLRNLGAGFWLFAAGTFCGIVSQVIEAVEYGSNDRRVAAFNELVVAEELLEMAAVLLIGLALVTALRVVAARSGRRIALSPCGFSRQILRRTRPEPEPGEVPGSVAIILDGNGRWAEERGLPVEAGHREGTRALRRTVEAAIDLGIESLTVYAFSTENWLRPPPRWTR